MWRFCATTSSRRQHPKGRLAPSTDEAWKPSGCRPNQVRYRQPRSVHMALDFKQVQKPGRKLRKFLKKMQAQPSPEQIHDFRTNSRQMEATLHAFGLDSARKGRRVLK